MTVTTILTLAHNPNIGIKQCGSDEELAAIAEKALKISRLHGRRAQSLTTLVLGGQERFQWRVIYLE